MIIPTIPGETREFICTGDEERENPVKWPLKNLSLREQAFIKKQIAEYTGDDLEKAIDVECQILSVGLVDGGNYPVKLERDPEKECVFSDIKPYKENSIASIPENARIQICNAIINPKMELTGEERKN